jgi:hypothetical protein
MEPRKASNRPNNLKIHKQQKQWIALVQYLPKKVQMIIKIFTSKK